MTSDKSRTVMYLSNSVSQPKVTSEPEVRAEINGKLFGLHLKYLIVFNVLITR